MIQHFRFLILFALSVNVLPMTAQNVDLKMGEEMKVGFSSTEIFGTDDEGNFYVLLNKGIKGSFIAKYNKNNALISKQEANFEFLKGVDARFTDYIVANNKVYIIISTSDKKSQRVFAHEINKKTLAIKTAGTKIGVFPFSVKNWDIEVSVTFSPDKSKILLMANSVDRRLYWVYFDTKSKTSKLPASYHCYSLDSDMNIIKEYKGVLPYTNDIYSMYEQVISNDAEVYFLGSYKDRSVEKKNDKTKEVVIQISPTNAHKIYKIDLSGTKEPYRTTILNSNEKDKLIITGFYNDNYETEQRGGSFHMVLDKQSSKIISEKSFPFDAVVGAAFVRPRKKDKVDLETVDIPRLIFKDIIYDSEGRTYLFAEDFNVYTVYRTTTSSTGATRTTSTTYMDSENILMFSYDKNGVLLKQNAIKRKMTDVYTNSPKHGQSTFGTFYNEDNKCFYLTYYGDVSRKDYPIICTKVDSDLNIGAEQIIIDAKDEKTNFSPRLNARITSNKMVGLFFFRKYQQFALFDFK